MKIIIDSLDKIETLNQNDIAQHFRHCGHIDEIHVNKRHVLMMVPDPQTAKYVLQMSGTMIKNVKIRVSYNKSMAKMKRGEMTVDDDDFTLIPMGRWMRNFTKKK